MTKKINFVDLFAGCGGLSEGFLETGLFRGLAHVEWELPMVETLRNRLKKRWGDKDESSKQKVILFDIQKTDELLYGNWSKESDELYGEFNSIETKQGLIKVLNGDNVDLIIGGPPCQAYSIHGRATDKNSMQNDYRNYLFESFLRIVNELKPKAFIFENVTGMLSAKPGGTLVVDRIYRAVNEIGYSILPAENIKNAVFNALDFSVPQNRDRVILFGVRNNSEFLIDKFYRLLNDCKNNKQLTVRDAIGSLPPIYPLTEVKKIKGKNVSHYSTDVSDPFHSPRHCSLRDIKLIREWIGNDMNRCTQQQAIDFYKKITGKDTLYRKYRNLEWDKPSPTVVAHLQKDGYMFLHPDIEQSRFITIREAALLMSFPSDYEFIGNRASCYKMIGNAVPVNFAKAIAKTVYKVLNE